MSEETSKFHLKNKSTCNLNSDEYALINNVIAFLHSVFMLTHLPEA